jgi:RecB family exonuclease
VHRAQQAFWSQVGGHAALLALDATALESALAAAVDAALDAFARHRPRRLPPRLEALERRRLAGLLGDWLALERLRAPFVVEQREQALTLDIGGITVTGRVDRIDRLPDGRQVLLDYKTGTARTAAWWGARPDEPQLPLYAASGGFDLAAVAFAQVRRQALRFHSVVDAGDPDAPPLLPGATRVDAIRPPPAGGPYATLAEAVAAWRVTLTTLGTAFRTGDARVDPKRADTCAWCDLPGLCRIAELRPAYGAGLDGESGAGRDAGGDATDGTATKAGDG